MSDEEIIKSLECCSNYGGFDGMHCKDCPYSECDSKKGCCGELCEDALDLINRQRAEIEKLKGYNEDLQLENETLSIEIDEIKSEAVREFAERLKEIVKFTDDTYECWEIEGYIDDLVKEMVGDIK